MSASEERHRRFAAALPVGDIEGPVVDLGCGGGLTLVALRERLGSGVALVGVEREPPVLDENLAADPRVSALRADLNEPLPFEDGGVAAAVCRNTLECLPHKEGFLREVARVLVQGGHLLLGHTDFDTMVFDSSDIGLTRRLVHANADTQEPWMDAADGTIGRKLPAIARRSPLDLVDTFAWVTLDTTFEEGGEAHTAVRSIAGAVRRDGDPDLGALFAEWLEELRSRAGRGEFLFSVNDYAVLLRKSTRS